MIKDGAASKAMPIKISVTAEALKSSLLLIILDLWVDYLPPAIIDTGL